MLSIFLILTTAPLYSQYNGAVVNASIINPIEVIEDIPLNFGTIISLKTGKVTITPTGERFSDGILVLKSFSAGLYKVTGQQNTLVSITFPSEIKLQNGKYTLEVRDWKIFPSSIILNEGVCFVFIGATLFSESVIPGVYAGVYTLIFDYY